MGPPTIDPVMPNDSDIPIAGFDEEPWWSESKLIPYVAPIAQKLSELAAEGMDALDQPVDKIESVMPSA